jgi:uncharacterized membrane protein
VYETAPSTPYLLVLSAIAIPIAGIVLFPVGNRLQGGKQPIITGSQSARLRVATNAPLFDL